MALTKFAHQLIREHFVKKEKRLALDLTLGNGHDCLFLLELGFQQVIGFDIQESAIEIVQTKLQQHHDLAARVQLLQTGHENLDEHVKGELDCAMLNLGYLPHGDKTITTLAETSLVAINSAMARLSSDGLITILCYPGHAQGKQELNAIHAEFAKQPSGFNILEHQSSAPSSSSPVLFTITRA